MFDIEFIITYKYDLCLYNCQYSGGQASEGQGGFYGSGGARVSTCETEHKPEMVST